MASAISVSNYLISKSLNDLHNQHEISPLKLQKLLYYAQGWYSVLNSDKLIVDEEFEAWVHGPVIRSVYNQFKDYGYRPIKSYVSEEIKKLDEKEKSVLDIIWEIYGQFDAKTLEELTHSENPWINARGKLEVYESSDNVISFKSINKYFQKYSEKD
ncbi:type II toxin-antitoxin system antitoxin SocA domain-containing protein [Alkalicoccobacillus gibsonii]|uniref:Type II toxin-antitoxin system antitoxin SocA domain-containing protein n=1 Tax=Alkalicoccobacillus gibsonii TaxID=79881 RepID=A0ABU9VEI1_9BACI